MAKTAQNKASEININLMPSKEPSGTAGAATHWALTVGRYLIIVTEIVAIAVFILSIKLATDKQTLKEDIQRLGNEISQQRDFENEFRLVQQRVNEIRRQRDTHFQNNLVVTEFLKLLPKGMVLETLVFDGSEISFSGEFDNPKQLQTLINAFSKSDKLVGLDISELESPSEKSERFTFSASGIVVQSNFEQAEEDAGGKEEESNDISQTRR